MYEAGGHDDGRLLNIYSVNDTPGYGAMSLHCSVGSLEILQIEMTLIGARRHFPLVASPREGAL